jgi:hypothetical protein
MLKSLPETMFWEVVSVSPIPTREIALRAASVLDDAGDLAPDRGAFSAQTRPLDAGGLRGLIAGVTGKQVRNEAVGGVRTAGQGTVERSANLPGHEARERTGISQRRVPTAGVKGDGRRSAAGA